MRLQTASALRKISVVIAGSGELREATVSPGETVGEMLKAVGLEGYQVSQGSDQPVLAAHDEVFRAVPEGATLYATTPAEAGSARGEGAEPDAALSAR